MFISNLMRQALSVELGLLIGFLAITNAISLIALIFSGDLMPYFSIGIGMALIEVSVLAIVMAWKSQTQMMAETQDIRGELIILRVNAFVSQIKIEENPPHMLP